MQSLVTGGTGFIGRRLLAKLDRPSVLTRHPGAAERTLSSLGARAVGWNPSTSEIPTAALEGAEVVFNLAGDPVAGGRWTAAKKARIRDSRVLGTRSLVAALAKLNQRPRVLVSASAVGYYGDRGEEVLDEQSPPGSDFLAEVCAAWEHEAGVARELGIRVVPIRIGVVLGRGGGALAKMLLPFRLGLGSPLGSGDQYMPWIHLDDLVDLMLFAAERETVAGPLNGTAPHPATNRQFTDALGRALGRPTFLPAVPSFALKLLAGEFAEVLLASQRAIPRAATAAGFVFRYPELEGVLQAIV